jgi:hypothetical protein
MSFSYAGRENSSFVHAVRGAYIACMKNRYPTQQELYALEHEARRLRAAEIARLVSAAVQGVRGLFTRVATVRPAKGLRHA